MPSRNLRGAVCLCSLHREQQAQCGPVGGGNGVRVKCCVSLDFILIYIYLACVKCVWQIKYYICTSTIAYIYRAMYLWLYIWLLYCFIHLKKKTVRKLWLYICVCIKLYFAYDVALQFICVRYGMLLLKNMQICMQVNMYRCTLVGCRRKIT